MSEPTQPSDTPKKRHKPPLDLGRYADRIVATREIPPREARYAEFPATLHPKLQTALGYRGIHQLYVHQARGFEAAERGEHVVVTTGTASGKSLTYLLPVLQSVLQDASARSLLLFPTKALSQDQLRGIVGLIDQMGGPRIDAGVYDGDTPPAERVRIRDRAHLVLTNPDMLNTALLPNHGRQGFSHIFRNLKYIVVDELHTYRGAFGAHFAGVMRRLWRICQHYGSNPTFLCSSATIANAREHAELLCLHQAGAKMVLIDEDGSPSAGKVIHFWQPPMLKNEQRKMVASEMAVLLPWLIEQRHRTIAFCRSRKETEIVLKESRDRLARVAGHDESYLLAGYRGGYTPEERRKVEQDLSHGRLLGVVSTNALELGIDIGALEVVVQGGFPGTRASFWQQMGRAGRRQEKAHAIVLLAVTPVDQHIAENPDWLVGQPAEHAVVDRDNLAIQLAHVRAAAAELPLSLDDAAIFPDLGEILPVLAKAGEVRQAMGAWQWCGSAFPAGEFSLRNVDKDRFKLVNRVTGTTITEMDRPQVYREAHPRAVYLHDGVQYQVEALDLVGHVATVVPVEQHFYTQPDVRSHIDVLLTQESKASGRSRVHFGDVRVQDDVVGYKMLEFQSHQNLGYEALHEHLRLRLETEAVWLQVPEDVLAALGQERQDALSGVVHAITACARLKTMAEASDLRGSSFHYTDDDDGRTATGVVCYDAHPGGLGYAAKSFDFWTEVLTDANHLVQNCRCKSGCPACVGDWVRDKRLIAWALQNFDRAIPLPSALRRPGAQPPVSAAEIAAIPPLAWEETVPRWREVCTRLRQRRCPGAEVLASVLGVEVRDSKLVVHLTSPGLAAWLEQDDTRRRLVADLAAVIAVPADFALAVEVGNDERERALHKQIKVQRRHDDLTTEAPATEREANQVLASGYVLAGDDSIN
ncbi:MAG: DEAD/DEAH box helicase [Deltaproteobacteria bacterium]|nr:DEAD/DEAH box helicase [Deltaproteobacteria bacterium]